jgi:hypothetical protein
MSVLAAEEWRAIVAPHFGFLEDRFHWSLTAEDDSTNWETTVTYARDPAAVIVRYSVEFNRAEVELVRMVDGKIPPVPIFIHPDTRIDRCDLDNLLILKAPSVLEALRRLGGLKRSTSQRALALQADALQRYALEFLWLDMSVFDELDQLIKARVATNPQRVTVWVPQGASEGATAKTVSDVHRVDPQIPVDVREYSRPVGGKAKRRWPWQPRTGGSR